MLLQWLRQSRQQLSKQLLCQDYLSLRRGGGDTGGGEPSMEAPPRWNRKYCKRH
ncbi:hypothetical protein COLO4_37648 [Corchorus olitorius]|uniref:Uncharacterized protein n=1 Tax=Corchorus olitorius TaxID=93759 RepID=A0A1R3G058_9ROSI|nr:hypothetical protein COLO4_37648 [Corchorus olitorius]